MYERHGKLYRVLNFDEIDEDADMICNNIEARLSLCDNLESMIEDTLQKVNALRQSVLKQAFEGRL